MNSYTQIDATTGDITYPVPKGGIIEITNTVLQTHNIRGQLNFNKAWGIHEIIAIGGAEIRNSSTNNSVRQLFGYQENTLSFGNVDYTKQFPNYVSGYYSNIINLNNMDKLLNRFVSSYANASYVIQHKYGITGSGRRDASNLFGLSTNNKFNLLWSTGASWTINEEKFYHWREIPYLRLRVTYGYSGNIDPTMSAVTTIKYNGNSTYISNAPIASFNGYANPELKWEKVKTWNAGLDFKALGNRVSGSLEIYQKSGSDLFGYDQIDVTTGVNPYILKNSASMLGKGIDVALNSLTLDRKYFKWNTQFNLSVNKDKVTKYYFPNDNRNGSSFIGGYAAWGVEKAPVYAVYSYKWAGLDPENGDPRGYVNGEISKNYSDIMYNSKINDLDISGSALPGVFGSLGNSFSYKNVSFGFRLSYKFGYYFRRNSIDYTSLYYYSRGHSDISLRWKNPGDENHTIVPSMQYPVDPMRDAFFSGSSALVENASHIRLNYIQLNYKINLNKSPLLRNETLDVFFNANDLGLLWKANKAGLDPDFSIGMPPVKSYSIGFKLYTN